MNTERKTNSVSEKIDPAEAAENANQLHHRIEEIDRYLNGDWEIQHRSIDGFLFGEYGESESLGIIELLELNQKQNFLPNIHRAEIEKKVEQLVGSYLNAELEKQAAMLGIIEQSQNTEAVEAKQPIVDFDPESFVQLVKDFIPKIKSKLPASPQLIKIEARAGELQIRNEEVEESSPEKIERYRVVVLRNQLEQKILPALTKIEKDFFDIKFLQKIFKKVGIFSEVQTSLVQQNDFYDLLARSQDKRDIRIIRNWEGDEKLDFSIDGKYGDAFYLAIKYLQFKEHGDNPKEVDGILGSGTAKLLVAVYKQFEKENPPR